MLLDLNPTKILFSYKTFTDIFNTVVESFCVVNQLNSLQFVCVTNKETNKRMKIPLPTNQHHVLSVATNQHPTVKLKICMLILESIYVHQ